MKEKTSIHIPGVTGFGHWRRLERRVCIVGATASGRDAALPDRPGRRRRISHPALSGRLPPG